VYPDLHALDEPLHRARELSERLDLVPAKSVQVRVLSCFAFLFAS
jgi:hypothetical protein